MIDMNTNKIGVIIPVYNVEPYLHRCVDSILAQTYKNIQIVLVDDGSTDNSSKICDEYAAQDDRIVVIHQKNQGQSAARNAGLDYLFEKTDCAYINFVDSDDWIHPRTLEVLLKALQEKQVDVSICGFQRTSGEEVEVPTDFSVMTWTPEEFYALHITNFVIVCGKLYKKDCFLGMRFPVGQKYGEDAFVTIRILFQYEKVAVLEAALYVYYHNPNSVTQSQWSPAHIAAIDALFDQIEYFDLHHFDKAKMACEKGLLWTISDQLTSAERIGSRKNVVCLRKLLRKQLTNKKKQLNLSLLQTSYLYEAAYPKQMKIYWYIIAVLKKLHLYKLISRGE